MDSKDAFLRQDILSFLEQVRPDLGRPALGYLGGSQALENGALAVKSSDYDVLVFFPKIERAVSYTFYSEDNARKYDLILRDPETFYYDVDEEIANTGRGTLLHLVAFGRALFGKDKESSAFQSIVRSLHHGGSHLLHPIDRDETRFKIASGTFQFSSSVQGMRLAFSLSLLNHITVDYLRCSGKWAAPGKIGSRFLHEYFPDFKARLDQAFYQAVHNHDFRDIRDIANYDLSAIHSVARTGGKAFSKVKTVGTFPRGQVDTANVMAYARPNLDALAYYLRKASHPETVQAASTWGHLKLELSGNAVTPDRIGRKSGEYLYALARGVSVLSDVTSALSTDEPSTALSRIDRLNILFDTYRNAGPAILAAYAGHPDALHEIFNDVKSRMPMSPLPYLYRPSPKYFRKASSTYMHLRDHITRPTDLFQP